MNEFVQVLKNNPKAAYDFISNNYYKMSVEELKDITKELLYAIHTNTTEKEHDKILSDVAEELEQQYED